MKSSTATNLAIFALFFGISLVDALGTRNWWRALFWIGIGVAFLAIGARGKRKER